MRTQSETDHLTRENAGERVVINFTFAFDWLREGREFSEPITERSTSN